MSYRQNQLEFPSLSTKISWDTTTSFSVWAWIFAASAFVRLAISDTWLASAFRAMVFEYATIRSVLIFMFFCCWFFKNWLLPDLEVEEEEKAPEEVVGAWVLAFFGGVLALGVFALFYGILQNAKSPEIQSTANSVLFVAAVSAVICARKCVVVRRMTNGQPNNNTTTAA
jgi:hypothetical protein